MYAYGLTAGLNYTEMRHLLPGFIIDMFRQRLDYDSKMAGAGFIKKIAGGSTFKSQKGDDEW